MRGTGSSEGHSNDEYSVQESKDGQDAINWLAKQSWCNGKLGMFGYSYSGTSTINAAMQAPEPLKAVAAAYFADDRYAADTHYAGGSFDAHDRLRPLRPVHDLFQRHASVPRILKGEVDGALEGAAREVYTMAASLGGQAAAMESTGGGPR